MESRSCLLLVPRCYGFGTVLDSSDDWFQGESPADRLPGCPCAELEGKLREEEESPGAQASERTPARHFKRSDFGHRPQAAGRIRVSVWGGALSMGHTLVTLSCDEK